MRIMDGRMDRQADGQAENKLPPSLSGRAIKATVYSSKTSKTQYKVYLKQCFNNIFHIKTEQNP